MPNSKQSRAVVLLSGGMDSCVSAALAARDYDAAAVHVSYGQRTEERERQSFLGICERLGIRDKLVVRNEALRAIGGSALTDDAIAVPRSGLKSWERKRCTLARLSRTVLAIRIAVLLITGRSTMS
jgi:7-cyano-7-deazaguanine synthase